MDEDKKKKVMLGIIVFSVLVVAIMTVGRMGGDDDTNVIPEFEGQVEWVLCRNPGCEADYSVPMKVFYEYMQEHREPGSSMVPALVCEKCNQESVYRAVKCGKCELVFEPGSIYQVHGDRRDYSDRCPKCKYSKHEEDRGVKYKPKR
jgi:hypothetical protein